jgi:hypothetical protein
MKKHGDFKRLIRNLRKGNYEKTNLSKLVDPVSKREGGKEGSVRPQTDRDQRDK